jgi:NarL family two-component system sensor histidine kinase YdfH
VAVSAGRDAAGDKHMSARHKIGPLGWFLLAWVILAYVWGLLYLWGFTYGWEFLGVPLKEIYALQSAHVHSPHPEQVPAFFVPGAVQTSALFTVLMLAFGALLWVGLVGKATTRVQWLYFLVLDALAVAVGSVLQQESIVLSLFLALMLGAVAIVPRARSVALVIGSSAVLFLFSLFLNEGPWVWQDWLGFLAVTDYAALILFVLGFIVLYVQQLRAHAQLEAAHARLGDRPSAIAGFR